MAVTNKIAISKSRSWAYVLHYNKRGSATNSSKAHHLRGSTGNLHCIRCGYIEAKVWSRVSASRKHQGLSSKGHLQAGYQALWCHHPKAQIASSSPSYSYWNLEEWSRCADHLWESSEIWTGERKGRQLSANFSSREECNHTLLIDNQFYPWRYTWWYYTMHSWYYIMCAWSFQQSQGTLEGTLTVACIWWNSIILHPPTHP